MSIASGNDPNNSNAIPYNQYSNMSRQSDKGGRKRFRRTANEIERRFVCWCNKAYGSEGSLN